jgi:hypothetical protein
MTRLPLIYAHASASGAATSRCGVSPAHRAPLLSLSRQGTRALSMRRSGWKFISFVLVITTPPPVEDGRLDQKLADGYPDTRKDVPGMQTIIIASINSMGLLPKLYPLGHFRQPNSHIPVFLRRPCVNSLARSHDFNYIQTPSVGHVSGLGETRLARLRCSPVFRHTKTSNLENSTYARIAQW